MFFTYKNKKLQRYCSRQREADRKFGVDNGKKLRTRLADLDAASRVGELVAGRPHPLKGDREGEFSLDLAGGARLIFAAVEPIPKSADGSIDWPNVTKIMITFIGDHHG